ncbi:MAG: hypothetical protein K9G76_08005, partial [Bacteroidales bacterium]|nr:hypothetical protein [Bacteroidales bacterium]MCF8404795.1 hypothetical protein [Bacteroidales bacterium]
MCVGLRLVANGWPIWPVAVSLLRFSLIYYMLIVTILFLNDPNAAMGYDMLLPNVVCPASNKDTKIEIMFDITLNEMKEFFIFFRDGLSVTMVRHSHQT